MHLKKLIFFLLLFFISCQSVHIQSNEEQLKKADNLFAQTKYNEAERIYYNFINEKNIPTPAIFLKLAYISEKKENISKTLFYLNLYFENNPNESTLIKMNNLAEKYNVPGYSLNDFYIILLVVKQYFYILMLLAVIIGLYVTVVFILKRYHKEAISISQKFVLFLYVIFLLGLVYLRIFYQQGIVHLPNTSLRAEPSAASALMINLTNGEKLNIFGSQDVWLRVMYNNKFYFVHKSNIWLVK